jgi:hypothetical protein
MELVEPVQYLIYYVIKHSVNVDVFNCTVRNTLKKQNGREQSSVSPSVGSQILICIGSMAEGGVFSETGGGGLRLSRDDAVLLPKNTSRDDCTEQCCFSL